MEAGLEVGFAYAMKRKRNGRKRVGGADHREKIHRRRVGRACRGLRWRQAFGNKSRRGFSGLSKYLLCGILFVVVRALPSIKVENGLPQ